MLISSFTLAMTLYPGRAPRKNRHRKFSRRFFSRLGLF